ncbi:U32 family peptidase C-terminal domain-containing protein, partial [Klebsiella pneumoniae]|nr:U32 family peptidase C-terminal domain-containing protein [Klebsiella pneumoniae]
DEICDDCQARSISIPARRQLLYTSSSTRGAPPPAAHPHAPRARHTPDYYQNHEAGYSVPGRQQFVGEFTGERNGPLAAVAVKNKFSVGDSLELMTPQGNVNFTLEHMENGKGETMPVAPGDGYTVWLPLPDDLPLQYALLMRNFTGQTTRNPHGN